MSDPKTDRKKERKKERKEGRKEERKKERKKGWSLSKSWPSTLLVWYHMLNEKWFPFILAKNAISILDKRGLQPASNPV